MFFPSLYFSEVFCGENGEVLKENDTIRFPKLAQTYRKISEEGADAFYEGELAQNLVKDIQAAGGVSCFIKTMLGTLLLCLVCLTDHPARTSGKFRHKTIIGHYFSIQFQAQIEFLHPRGTLMKHIMTTSIAKIPQLNTITSLNIFPEPHI